MNHLSGHGDFERVSSRSKYDDVPDLSKQKQPVAVVSVNSVAAKTIYPSASGTKGEPTIVVLNEAQVTLLKGKSDQKPDFDDEAVDKLVDAMLKEAFIVKGKVSDVRFEEAKEQMKKVALYVLENANKFWNTQEDKYVRPEESGVAVPITFTRDGHVVISLKLKLGKKLGHGAFGLVKNAIVLSFNLLGEAAKLTIAKGASKTMVPKDETGKKTIEVEKSMMFRLKELEKELGPHRSVLRGMSITEYKAKDKILKEQETGIELERDVGKLEEKPKQEKIGMLLEFCNGGNVKQFIKNHFPSFPDDEVELIAEDILNGAVFLHDNKIFHSDLKPKNILLIHDAAGKVTGAKIADFGCARNLEDPEQRTYFTGDRGYHSPELRKKDLQMNERIDPELKEETEKLSQAKKAHEIALAKYEASKKNVDEKKTAASQPTEAEKKAARVEYQPGKNRRSDGAQFRAHLRTAIAQQELLEAQNASSKAKEEVTAAVVAYTNAENAYSNKRESLIDKYRKEIYPIDETILKSDIYAIGMIFEEMFLGTKIIAKEKQPLAEKLEEAQASLATAKASLEKAEADLKTAEEADQEELKEEIDTLTTQIEGIEENIVKIQEDTEKVNEKAAKIEERISPEMKKLIADMKSDDPSARLTVNDALHRFQELKGEGKIFISEQVAMADTPAAEETAAAAATEGMATQAQEIATDEETTPDFGKGSNYNIPEKYLKKTGY